MGWQCVVSGCSVTDKKNPHKFSGFSFPSDEKICREWCEIISLDFYQKRKSDRVCEKHFDEKDVMKDDHKVMFLNEIMKQVSTTLKLF